MAKKVYLVDTENVGAIWKHLFQIAANIDDILLFYTENTPFLSYNDLEYILSYKDRFTMIKCYTGNNALDFQLVSYVGFMMKTGAKTQYIIVSNDTGYDAMIKFWTDRDRKVSRMSQAQLIQTVKEKEEKQSDTAIKEEKEKEPVSKTEETETKAETVSVSVLDNQTKTAPSKYSDEEILIQGVLSDEKGKEVISWIAKMLHKYSVKHLQQIHCEMVKKYGQEDGGQMYKLIKPILKQFYQMKQLPSSQKEEQNSPSKIGVVI